MTTKSKIRQILFFSFFFFCWLSLDLVVWPRIGDPFILLLLLLLLLLLFLLSFSHQRKLMVFYMSLSGSKSPQVS